MNRQAYFKEYNRKYYASNKDRERERGRRKHFVLTYGITWDDVLKMYENQDGKCACCFKPFDSIKEAQVEHCHTSKKIRGLVHTKCNVFIDAVEDFPNLLELAKEYLKRNSS